MAESGFPLKKGGRPLYIWEKKCYDRISESHPHIPNTNKKESDMKKAFGHLPCRSDAEHDRVRFHRRFLCRKDNRDIRPGEDATFASTVANRKRPVQNMVTKFIKSRTAN